jgi:outer membrane receptor protein involved in Fe transport
MRKLFAVSILSLLFIHISLAQISVIKGTLKDASNGKPLDGATVLQPPANGTLTDEKGNFQLNVESGDVTLIFSYLGMQSDTQIYTVKPGETKTVNIEMGEKPTELGTVVIGESKYAVKLQKLTGSTDVIKPRMLENNNITNLQQAITKIPGVTILDGQASIRGGSGYAYGSGSRVTLVIDDLPLMSPDRGEIKWSFVPTENVEQMELMKGASTLQYGSSALNGVLQVRTSYPREEPQTKFTFYYEGVGKPPVDSFQWWKRDGQLLNAPNTAGMTFLHSQKFKDVDFVISGMAQGMQSHLNEEYEYLARFNTKLKYVPHKFNRLSMGLNTTVMYRRNGFQFYWKGAGSPYISADGVSIDEDFIQYLIDPWISYRDKSNSIHKINLRVFNQRESDAKDGRPSFTSLYTEYQFRHQFGSWVNLLVGAVNNHSWMEDNTLGQHQMDQPALYAIGEFTWKGLTINGGLRGEALRLDSSFAFGPPVGRLGLNWQIRKLNYIRASWGSAFRFPSIAERFVLYDLAGVKILPNPGIKPESGWTAELGYKRSFQIGKFLGYYDFVLFWTEFKNMIEFTFGTKFENGSLFPYFQSQNVSKARIFGWETSIAGEGKVGPVDINTLIGYTYFYGVDLNDTSATRNVGDFIGDAFSKFVLPTPKDDSTSTAYSKWDKLTAGMLRYRNRHTMKADIDLAIYSKYHIGTSIQFYGYMTSVDKIFEVFIKDAKAERAKRINQGDWAWDLRAGYDFNKNISLNFIVKNVLNANYATRFTKPERPRSYTVQFTVRFGKSGTKDLSINNSSGGMRTSSF